ncbi:DUF4139 domain-containing protein [Myxococcota bacterium]|nr:DUF4139 domain-containing protein [Myxococcota bacterium]MBU1432695.1 DUF4139 domain-containing protein [Myxococcota bacterium]MBU1899122.1 DUF4139 domain-containing protein [Myxococcota bacterium]
MTEPRTLTLPIRRVTAFEDRAEVVRVAELELTAGREALRVPQVSLLTSEAHMTAWVEATQEGATAPARVDEVRVEHRLVPRDPAADQRARLRAEREAAKATLRAVQARLRRAEEREAEALEALRGYTLRINESLWGETGLEGVEGALEGLDELDAFAREAAARRWALEDEAAAAEEALKGLQAALAEIPEPTFKREADLLIRLSADEACRIKLSVAAVLPCALWRPAHEARLIEGGLEWDLRATVWQRTGEDWSGVALRLSTDRPSAVAELPPLLPDQLRLQERETPKQIVLAHRAEGARRRIEGAVTVEAAPGVYDGGEARIYHAEGLVDIPSDGRPHAFKLEGFKADCARRLTAYPEQSRQVFARVRLHNPLPKPLLAGPVTLIRDGAYMGVGDIQYVGPGEPFDLALGSDDRFRARLRRGREVEARRLSRDRVHYTTEVEVHGSAATPEVVEIVLRAPVSELKALKVLASPEHCDRPFEPDEDGLMRFEVTLASGAERFKVGFTFEKTGQLVLPEPWWGGEEA